MMQHQHTSVAELAHDETTNATRPDAERIGAQIIHFSLAVRQVRPLQMRSAEALSCLWRLVQATGSCIAGIRGSAIGQAASAREAISCNSSVEAPDAACMQMPLVIATR
jgi:hypothetical protein